ncbi:tetratricopeptide repeat protein [Leptolyngbya sp. AN03gr2]|uniref:tetratricopeptide repeat protein n=1 Tax=unclassified Leptolyngbya TaxID=2650499 RepID=UPI003D31F5EF
MNACLKTTGFTILMFCLLFVPAARSDNARANALNADGLELLRKGQAQEALPKFEQALIDVRMSNWKQGELTTLSNIGAAYVQIKNLPKALEIFEKALPIAKQIDQREEAKIITTIGRLQLALKQNTKAIGSFQRLLTVSQQIGDQKQTLTALENLGLAYLLDNQYQQAVESYYQALPIVRAMGDRQKECQFLQLIRDLSLGWEAFDPRYAEAAKSVTIGGCVLTK